MRNPRCQHISELDGLRGVAILLVMVFHFSGDIEGRSTVGNALLDLCGMGWIGVDLFFVLSGYLITGILLDTKGSEHYYLNFFARRTLRIFPLYYGVLFVVFVALPHSGVPALIRAVEQLERGEAWFWLYGTNVLIAWKGVGATIAGCVMLMHFWSLAVEEHFYLVWPGVVRRSDPQKMIYVGIILLVSCAAARAVMCYGADRPVISYCLTPFRIDSLAMGGILAAYVRWRRPEHNTLRRVAVYTIAAAAPVLVTLFFWRGGLRPHDPPVEIIGYPLLGAIFCAMIVLASDEKPHSLLGKMLGSRIVVSLGTYSYGLYVFHVLVWRPLNNWISVEKLAGVVGFVAAGFLHVVLLCAASYVLAYVSWHCYEKHALGLKRFF